MLKCLFGALFHKPDDPAGVLNAMAAALDFGCRRNWDAWSDSHVAVGVMGQTCIAGKPVDSPMIETPDGRFTLWLSGEIFACNGDDPPEPESFLLKLLTCAIGRDELRLSRIDGHYQWALWDRESRKLSLGNDRFGAIPLFFRNDSSVFLFGGGVRAILAAGADDAPDTLAISEMVTFGGFRLGSRCNVAKIEMMPCASVLSVQPSGSTRSDRYWRWPGYPSDHTGELSALLEEAEALWKAAIASRLRGALRPGQTLSGGLDSRAIMSEAAPRAPGWTAITFGIPGCDDAKYAEMAANAMNVRWIFHPLYSGTNPDWLERRSRLIQHTDGLLQLSDLMHLEVADMQAQLIDVHLSGYIGDAVCGPSLDFVHDAESLVSRMPYYGLEIGWPWEKALEWARGEIEQQKGTPARFVLFEHKLPQSTNLIFHAYSLWNTVRKPFTDYALFDFHNKLPETVRKTFYFHFLKTRYPACFKTIPNQKTGQPILTPDWRIQAERARRFIGRRVNRGLSALGMGVESRKRNFRADEIYWNVPGIQSRIFDTILRKDSISCDVLDRNRIVSLLNCWKSGSAPAQVIGALYVYEAYHRDLRMHIEGVRQSAASNFKTPQTMRAEKCP